MRTSLSGWLHRAQALLMMASAVYPVAFVVGMGADRIGAVTALTAGCLLLAEACILLPGRVRLIGGGLGAAALLALGAVLLPVRELPAALTGPVVLAALLLMSLPVAAWPPDREPHAVWPLLGLAGYVFLIEGLNAPWSGMKDRRILIPLWVGFVILLTLSLLLMNRMNVRTATAGRAKAPARVRQRNALMTLGYLALGVALAMLPGLARGLYALWRGLTGLIAAAAAWLMRLFPPLTGGRGTQEAAPAPEPFAMMAEPSEPGLFEVILQRVLWVIALVALALLAVALLRAVYRGLRRLARALVARLGRFAASAAEDYVDEVTDTREEGAAGNAILPWSRRRRIGAGGERRMPPRERVRHRYLRLRRKHPEWRPGWTARETIPPDSAEIYERARYSGHEIGEEEAERFMKGVRHL